MPDYVTLGTDVATDQVILGTDVGHVKKSP